MLVISQTAEQILSMVTGYSVFGAIHQLEYMHLAVSYMYIIGYTTPVYLKDLCKR